MSPLLVVDRHFPSFSPKAELGRKAALLPVLPIPASGNTQYEVTQASLLWAMAAALDLHREVALPVPLHKGLAPSVLPPHQLLLMRFMQNFSLEIFA